MEDPSLLRARAQFPPGSAAPAANRIDSASPAPRIPRSNCSNGIDQSVQIAVPPDMRHNLPGPSTAPPVFRCGKIDRPQRSRLRSAAPLHREISQYGTRQLRTKPAMLPSPGMWGTPYATFSTGFVTVKSRLPPRSIPVRFPCSISVRIIPVDLSGKHLLAYRIYLYY